MKIVRLNGGLGNQLFQISFALYAKRILHDDVSVDVSQFVSYRNRPLPRGLEVEPSLFGLRSTQTWKLMARAPAFVRTRFLHVFEQPSDWSIESIPRRSLFVSGYFQDTALVDLVEAEVVTPLMSRVGTHAEEDPYVAVHVRLGDYLDDGPRSYFGVVDPTWSLERCLDMSEARGIPRRVIFTDSPNELIRLVDPELLAEFSIDHSGAPIEVLAKISRADGFVMANSTLSWWGARLLLFGSPDRVPVIQPTPWTSVGDALDSTMLDTRHEVHERRLVD